MDSLLLKPGPGPWSWTLKNLDPKKPGFYKKHGINIRLKNISDFRELCFIKTAQCDLLFKISSTNRYLI